MRPSHGALPSGGVVSVFPEFDTPALLSRDLDMIGHVALHWYANDLVEASSNKPSVLLIPQDFWPVNDTAQTKILNEFVSDLCAAMKMEQRRFSIAQDWHDSRPVDDPDLAHYLHNVSICNLG